MMGKPLVLIGGGGHCRACIEVIETVDKYAIAGIVDLKEKKGTKVFSYTIFAADEDLPSLAGAYRHFLVTLGQLTSPERRRQLFETVKGLGARLPIIISPYAKISRRAEISEGTIVMHGAVVNAGAKVGRNCIINTAAVVEHDCVVGDHCHISTGGIVNGGSRIGEGAFIGSGGMVSNGLTIAAGAIIGAGAVVMQSIEEPGTYVGVPARRVK